MNKTNQTRPISKLTPCSKENKYLETLSQSLGALNWPIFPKRLIGLEGPPCKFKAEADRGAWKPTG